MGVPLQDQRGLRRALGRVGRHLRWARDDGIGRLVEEDQLDPIERIPIAWRKWRWRRSHHIAPDAVPVFVVGVQRSGTNMLIRGLERAPEFEVRNENDGKSFDRFLLRPDPAIRSIVEASGHRFVLFKPLCDSHRILELLDGLGTPSAGRAIWAYRDVDGRVRSAVRKFADANRRALDRIAADGGAGMWQAGGLSEERLELIRSLDPARLSVESAAALFWFIRNSLFFDLHMDGRADVALASYEATVRDPASALRALARFLGMPYRPELGAHIDARSAAQRPRLEIDAKVRELCSELNDRLDRTYAHRLATQMGDPS